MQPLKSNKMKHLILVSIAIIFVAMGCKSTKGNNDSDDESLYGKKWILTELNGQKIDSINANESVIFMTIDKEEMRINGNSGCNKFFGEVEQGEKQVIRFSQMGSTKMACPNMDEEVLFLSMLDETRSFTIEGKSLSLSNENAEVIATFETE